MSAVEAGPPNDELPSLDRANRSLSEALRTSFALLRVVMIGLVAYFGFSGMYTVELGTVAVHTRFGQILGEPGEEVRNPGGPYFALPAPIDRRIVVRTNEDQIAIDDDFWFATDEKTRLARKTLDEIPIPQGGLVPGHDGSLVTGDQTIVHGQWNVTYATDARDAMQFVRTFGDATRDEVRRAIRVAACRGIVHTVAGTTADAYLSASFDRDRARREIQEAADELGALAPGGGRRCGVTIKQVLLSQPTPPLRTRAAFLQVSQAESEKARKIEVAQRDRARTLGEAAGTEHAGLIEAIDRYETARADGSAEAIASTEAALMAAFDSPTLGGRVSQRISEARTYKTQVTELVRAEAESFARLYPSYRKNPRLARDFLWQETLRELMSGEVEKFYVPSSTRTLYLEISRDPAIQLRREQEKFAREIEQRKRAEK